MAEARRLITTKIKGEHHIQTWHVVYFDLDEGFLSDLFEDLMEDYEEAYSWGICGDLDGEIFSINVNSLMPLLNREEHEDFESESIMKDYRKLSEMLESYKGYTIYPGRKKKDTKVGVGEK